MKAEKINSSIVAFWEKLKTVRVAALRCTSDWRGSAEILVISEESQTILFHEKGKWENTNLSFTNIFRWTLRSEKISLEHLRFGSQFPVSLVDFTPMAENRLASVNPHLCGQDRYSAQILWNQEGIHLHWNIQGPLKTEEIYSYYL